MKIPPFQLREIVGLAIFAVLAMPSPASADVSPWLRRIIGERARIADADHADVPLFDATTKEVSYVEIADRDFFLRLARILAAATVTPSATAFAVQPDVTFYNSENLPTARLEYFTFSGSSVIRLDGHDYRIDARSAGEIVALFAPQNLSSSRP